MTPGPLAEPLQPAALRAEGHRFFGQPRGLAYLAFTEAWERFSYYGMSGLLVLYMAEQLLLPGHVEHVAGLVGFRSVVEAATGRLSADAFASQVYGLYSGLVYFTPVLGGMLADRVLGARRTVIFGALLMSAGHLAMAFDVSFLIALTLLIVGTGCLKGNISAQVGALYPRDDEARRTRGFTIFSMGINVGATAGPLACGALAQVYGWHAGFGAAGVLMLVALATYLAGLRHLPPDPRRRRKRHAAATPLSRAEWRTIALLLAVMGISIFQSIAYYQCFDAGMLWIRDAVHLQTSFGTIPIAWFSSIDAATSVLVAPLLVMLWQRQSARGREPNDITKMGIGSAICAVSAGLLTLASALAGSGKVSGLWPFGALVGMGIAFLYYWPTLLALVSRAAPPRVNATMMGVAFLSLFVGNTLMGRIAGLYGEMSPTAFWALDAGIGATEGVLVLLFGRRLSRALGSPP